VPTAFDVQYIPGDDPVLNEGETSILVGGFNSTFPPTATAIFEFPLVDIPEGAILTGATLRMDVLSQSGSPTLTVVTYPGDGVASLDDGMAEGMETMIGPVNLITAETLALDVDYVQSLLGTASHLGVRLSSETVNKFLSIATLEHPDPSMVPTLVFEYLYELTEIVGDFNGDGTVDAADYTVWRNTLGSTTELAADADGSGEVDAEDYLLWKAQFGKSLGGSLAVAPRAVPEPATILLVVGAIFLATRFRPNTSTRGVGRRS
jgi:hypothetical protein